MSRLARLDSPGILHHLMVRGIEKRRIVDGDRDRRNFVGRLGGLAWSLLSNHAHILVKSGDAYFQEFVRYIQLNPQRSGLDKDARELERYPWCGHGENCSASRRLDIGRLQVIFKSLSKFNLVKNVLQMKADLNLSLG